MVIITHISYPSENVQAMAKRYLEAPQPPDFITRRGPYVSSNLSAGMLALTIDELDNSKIDEGIQFASNFVSAFYGIPGFKHEIKTYLEVEEALKTIGMA